MPVVGASKAPVVVTIQDSTGRRARATLALGLDACSDRGGAVCGWGVSGNLIGVVALLFRLAASGEGVGVPQAAVLLQAVPAVASVAGFGASRNLRAVAPVVTSAVTSVAGLAIVALVVVVAGIWVVRIVGEASSLALASTMAGIIVSVIYASLAEWTAGVGAGVAGATTVIRSARRPRVGAAIAVAGALSVAGVVVALLSTSLAAATGVRATSVAPGTTRT